MNLLVVGNGNAGSWQCRGEQIGRALGATVAPAASDVQMRAADLLLVVKRAPPARVEQIRKAGRPWVYDIVDAYPQPECSAWSREEAVAWTRAHLARLRPDGVIWPNQRMADDVGFDGPQAVIYHHHRPGIRVNPVRKDVRQVAYEGCARYIEKWLAHLEAECEKRGWRFTVNPEHLADVDIVIALRGGNWDGYVPRHWKSNVKLANAHGSGTPFVGTPEEGYRETASGCEYWANDLGSLRTSFDWLTDQRAREEISDRFRQRAQEFTLEKAAERYREFLCGSKFF